MGSGKHGKVVVITITLPARISRGRGQTVAGLLEVLAKAEPAEAVAATVLWGKG